MSNRIPRKQKKRLKKIGTWGLMKAFIKPAYQLGYKSVASLFEDFVSTDLRIEETKDAIIHHIDFTPRPKIEEMSFELDIENLEASFSNVVDKMKLWKDNGN